MAILVLCFSESQAYNTSSMNLADQLTKVDFIGICRNCGTKIEAGVRSICFWASGSTDDFSVSLILPP